MNRPARVGFLRMGPHPIPNRLLPEALAHVLPDSEVAVLDVEARIRRERPAVLANAAWVAAEQGAKLLRGQVSPWQAFFTTTHLFRAMSRLAREWVSAHAFDWTLQIQSLFDGRAAGIPHFVYTDHTHLANLSYPGFDRRALRGRRWLALEGALYRGAHRVFTRSAHVSDSLVRDYGIEAARIVCVGAGANARLPGDADATSAESASGGHAEPGAPARGADILFVGVDWERKGGPELARAFARVRERHPHATLTVVGCAPAGLPDGARALGRVPVEHVHRHYERADLFCLPTRREPFGIAFVEALHHGLPIVATRVGAVPDLVTEGENGFLVEVGDDHALATRLDVLLSDPALRRRMGHAARRRARERYTWPAVARRIADAVAAALAAPAPPAGVPRPLAAGAAALR